MCCAWVEVLAAIGVMGCSGRDGRLGAEWVGTVIWEGRGFC